jgi:phage terminase small subunit
MALEKPASITSSPFKSAKWDELTKGRNFNTSDIPALELLCAWYEVASTCIDDISVADGVQVAYQNDLGDLKALPQLSTMKMASAEIRALNKQLGINDEAKPERPEGKATMLHVILQNRQARAANSNKAVAG